ncbi:dNTP triphosphohydrolase [Rhizobacter sp. J219]|uniref:deoxyguanosinetriphosphate triphosphohydrolase family protein n=1 Tax=Rhizobacter sp. J219 TaxID=2898430 RepID=UPI0021507E74|nr:dNTP triphosphohydrolase [Rhizobacter sp. J219]MCR5883732.1 dNTP triphosphohydrolase [Rhizobacter sp. J219]
MYNSVERERISGEPGQESSEAYRTAFRKDFARLIHAPSFRRLQNKTQLYPGIESDFFRNRLTHSLEVSQVAATIAMKLNAEVPELRHASLDTDLVAFAGLAHDLGHPPFGHNGEHALDDLMYRYGGFEGNAQTLRILSRLEKKAANSGATFGDKHGRLGLDLTYRALAATLKYDREIPLTRKKKGLIKGYYSSETKLVEEIKRRVLNGSQPPAKFKTVECQIMDIADDISYSTYDLEDSLKGGFLSPLQILEDIRSNDAVRANVVRKVRAALMESGQTRSAATKTASDDNIIAIAYYIFEQIIPEHHSGKRRDESMQKILSAHSASQTLGADGYTRTEFTSDLIGTFIEGVRFKFNEKHPALSKVWLEEKTLLLVETLKHLNFELVIRSPRLRLVHFRGYEVVKKIFNALSKEDGESLLPKDFQELHAQAGDKAARMRVICDFVAGMTDRYAAEFYERLYGGNHTIFKPI